MTVERRQRAFRKGRLAESLCALMLMFQGYRIVAQRLRSPVGEIDILARRGKTLAIVEVKARPTQQAAAESVTGRQRARLIQAAQWLIAGRPEFAALEIRFDVMLVSPWRMPKHIVDAWRIDLV
ncbi:MAG: YraN family protein [Alphaproteobacteria bacterium]|jgi:putative endonuclease|nr:YraN family protein [Alphaproteobacteria bacterium]MDP6602999.1 YraN family protein [Rhodospirillales bacterium]